MAGVETARRILILLAVAGVLGASANALSPRGLSWSRPLGRGIAAQVADAGLVPVDLKTVQGLLKTARIIDARSAEEFTIGRLPGALLVRWDPETPPSYVPVGKDQPIVVYCGNEFCEQSLGLGRWLKANGWRDVAVFVDGYDAWWNAGGPVDQD